MLLLLFIQVKVQLEIDIELFCILFYYYAISGGHNLANFLVDSGWYMAAETVLVATKDIDESLLQHTDELSHYNHCQVSTYLPANFQNAFICTFIGL